ncbi:MAG: ABC transporter substrate-binding protein, partial [Lachnospiraceae bacterium]|nr:ABC transporter substrate-binding protein [Lachnospiraceae bacterium]
LVQLANDPRAKTVAPEALASNELFAKNCVTADLIPSTDAMTEYNGDLTTLKNEIVAKVAMGEMTIEEGYAKYEADGGAAWSQQIVDSLNNQ